MFKLYYFVFEDFTGTMRSEKKNKIRDENRSTLKKKTCMSGA